jgi:2-aminoethylphosphonate-pyruvate transaminase
MAAGVGSRFGKYTEAKPKGFVVVGGLTMIERSIQKLFTVGIEKIIIGTGYHSSYYEKLAEQYPQIVCCKSDKFAETNSMYTLLQCCSCVNDDDFLLLESDLIYGDIALSMLISDTHPNTMLITPFAKQQDGYYIKTTDAGFLSDCTTDISIRNSYQGELVGIHKISNDTYKRMCVWYNQIWPQQPKLGYEYALLEMCKQGEKIYALKDDRIIWYEIDDEADLFYAEQYIIPHLYRIDRNIINTINYYE